ncbi:MAG: hypothetical protein H5T70_09365, partial [Chloroflexi bacterium]|nr:hypothetical protein [Chloroflexota bacterium]
KTIEELRQQLASFAQEKANREEVEQIVSEIDRLLVTRETLEARLQELDQKINALEKQWSALDASEIGESMSALQEEVERISLSLDGVLKKLHEVPEQEAVQELSSTLEGALAQLEALKSFTQDTLRQEIQVRIEAVERRMTELSENMLSALQDARVDSQELEAIKQALAELSASKKTLEERVNQVLEALEKEEVVENVQEDLNMLTQQKEALRAEIAKLGKERITIDQKLQEKIKERERIEQEIQELKATKGSLEEIARLEDEKRKAQEA